MTGRFDELLITVCKEAGSIQGLLDVFFDFMFRKTDFFYECDPGETMGFPPGVNTMILQSAFKKYQGEHYKKFPKKDPVEFQEKLAKYKQSQNKKNQPQRVLKTQVKPQQTKLSESQPKAPLLVPALQEKEAEIANTHNGGETQKYTWSQQSRDLQVCVPVPEGTTGKEVEVQIKIQHIKLQFKKSKQVILEGDLYQKISVANSFWRIEKSGKTTSIILNLEKADERIWSTIIIGDKEIDTSKVNNTKPLSDFDQETQMAIEKIRIDQHRKMQGLPTTDEQKQHQLLKTAWDSQGSPFKGTPFDPSKLNLQGFMPEGK